MQPAKKKSIALTALAAPPLTLLLLSIAFLVGASDAPKQSWFLVAKTSELPSDGSPILKTVSAKQFDAWTRLPDKPVCNVFVRKSHNADGVSAVHSWHHDAFRIPLRFDEVTQQYVSACWNVAFDIQGNEVSGKESIPMSSKLAQLPVHVADGVVWVKLDGVRY